jgi:HD domain
MDPMTSHLEQLEAAERQLLVFAREINHLYQAERARAAELERALDRVRGSYLDMIKTLAFVVEAKDPSTRAHLQRTHDYAVALAEAVGPELAADEQLRYGFLLHDVGKVGIPESVLNKPGPLDAREWEVMRAHPLLGVQMVAGIKSLGSAVEVIRCHHERWDGKGYPSGLAGEAIRPGLPGDRRRRRLPVRPGRGRRLHRHRPRPLRPPRLPARRGCGQPGARLLGVGGLTLTVGPGGQDHLAADLVTVGAEGQHDVGVSLGLGGTMKKRAGNLGPASTASASVGSQPQRPSTRTRTALRGTDPARPLAARGRRPDRSSCSGRRRESPGATRAGSPHHRRRSGEHAAREGWPCR